MSFKLMRLKYAARFGYGETITSEEQADGVFKVFGSNGPYATCGRPNTLAPVIIVGRKGSYGKVNWSDDPCFASDTTFVIDKRTTKNHLRWLYYLLQTLGIDEGSGEAAVPGLNRESAYGKEILVPSLERQIAIADFLDHETTRLDSLIAAKENLLYLLAEKRRALITSAVTCGINPKVRLKESGVPWLGGIPEHWDTRRLAFLFRERDERNQPDLPLLTVSINTGVSLRVFSDDRIEGMAADSASYKVARKGDVAFNKMRMWQGAVGVTPTDGLVSPDYVVAEPDAPMDVEYFGLLFKTQLFSAETARQSHGITWDRLRLYWEDFRDIRVPVPPIEEQTNIVVAVNEQTAKLDALKAATDRTIALLRERRTALIAAAVTGKIAMPSEIKEGD